MTNDPFEEALSHFYENSAFVKATGMNREDSDKLFKKITKSFFEGADESKP